MHIPSTQLGQQQHARVYNRHARCHFKTPPRLWYHFKLLRAQYGFASKLRIQDDSGRVICNATELNERVTHHFGQQFNDPRVMELPAFTGVPSPLTMPITPGEVQRAISKLNSGRACGHDDLPADLLKSTADLIAPAIAAIFNDALEHHESLDTGKGVLILLQKPGKPVGPLTSVRPIVLLSALRKTLSLVVLSIIATKRGQFPVPTTVRVPARTQYGRRRFRLQMAMR